MKINVQNNYQPAFGVNISPRFEKFMRDYINCGKNRKQNNYRLNEKLEDLKKYGYDNYTINLVNKTVAWGVDYFLVATKEGQEVKDGLFLFKKGSVKQVINSFLDLSKSSFINRMRRKEKFYT